MRDTQVSRAIVFDSRINVGIFYQAMIFVKRSFNQFLSLGLKGITTLRERD